MSGAGALLELLARYRLSKPDPDTIGEVARLECDRLHPGLDAEAGDGVTTSGVSIAFDDRGLPVTLAELVGVAVAHEAAFHPSGDAG